MDYRTEVTDSADKTARDSVTVEPIENTPTAVVNVLPDEITPHNPITLDASESTTPVENIVSYEWDILKPDDSGEQTIDLKRSGEVIEENWEVGPLHHFYLEVTNDDGLSDRTTGTFRPEE